MYHLAFNITLPNNFQKSIRVGQFTLTRNLAPLLVVLITYGLLIRAVKDLIVVTYEDRTLNSHLSAVHNLPLD